MSTLATNAHRTTGLRLIVRVRQGSGRWFWTVVDGLDSVLAFGHRRKKSESEHAAKTAREELRKKLLPRSTATCMSKCADANEVMSKTKILLTQNALARELGVAQATLHARIVKGLLQPDAVTVDGRRLFDVNRVQSIRALMSQPVSLADKIAC